MVGGPAITGMMGPRPIRSPRFLQGGAHTASARETPFSPTNENLKKPSAACRHKPVPGSAGGSELKRARSALNCVRRVITNDLCRYGLGAVHVNTTRVVPGGIRSLAGRGASHPASLSMRSLVPPPRTEIAVSASSRQIPFDVSGIPITVATWVVTCPPGPPLLFDMPMPTDEPRGRCATMKSITRPGRSGRRQTRRMST